ncbi:FkbM family methyltransferase [Polynucleobacter paneuropaeus]|nr:FkbM family methyltransferase [Polynucleobacter paneuropaeus]MBT8541008.1 FkbM family methyltransferase [Polynucleobacter paneuropaeus]MBT8555577.1 FkbM family methyltransferase [Polynucleobacter paneuropaeus]MBT8560853.1 FkbM family methyltransferase [Polynucleobacter paneuropaeus]
MLTYKSIKKIIPSKIKNLILNSIGSWGYVKFSWAQEGEDLILNRIFSSGHTGFYVDIGAHDPFRFSNTYLLYKKGWRGLCVDPLPEAKKRFKKFRPKDIFINCGLGGQSRSMKYFMFSESAVNTFDEKYADFVTSTTSYKLLEKKEVKVITLSDFLNQYYPKNVEFDLLSIDAEAKDLEILKSNDWEKYRPKIVLVEDLNHQKNLSGSSEIENLLTDKNYQMMAKTVNSVFYIRNEN